MPDDPSFLELLERVRTAIREAGAAGPESCSALLILSGVSPEADSADYDLVLAFTESKQGLTGSCEYNADQFEDAQQERLTKHFAALLKEAATRPDARISTFEMLDAVEKARMLVEWNGEERGYPPHCVHELFEQQVERTPDSPAALFEGEQITYRELNRRANRLAHYLRRSGAGPEVMIGILMDASLEAVIAVFAVLKAGAAYVALNHNHPPQRLREIIRESRIPLAVTTSWNAGYHALAGETLEFVCLDLAASRIAEESASNPPLRGHAGQYVSVRYNVRFHGKAKRRGEHSPHLHVASDIAPAGDRGDDVCLVNTSWGFAARLFHPLALGAMVVIASEKDVRTSTGWPTVWNATGSPACSWCRVICGNF